MHEWLLEMTRRHHGPDEHTGAALMTMAQVGVQNCAARERLETLHRAGRIAVALRTLLTPIGSALHQGVLMLYRPVPVATPT